MSDPTKNSDTEHGGSLPEWSAEERRVLIRLEAGVRGVMDAALIDPRLIVLQGLVDAGETEGLSESDLALLAHHKEHLDEACEKHPALTDARLRVAEDAALFGAAWEEHLSIGRKPIRNRRVNRVRWPARIGLGLSALALGAMVYFAGVQETHQVAVTAPDSSNRVVELADGSTARLSAGSRLSYVEGVPFDRSVRLEGTAFFDIVPESTNFTVETDHARTTVLGTRFSVSAQANFTEVVLVTGKVAVRSVMTPDVVVVLHPGEFTRVARAAAPSAPEAANIPDALAWTDLLILRETSMNVVAARLEETRGTTVQLDAEIGQLLVTGTFGPEQSAQEILSILSATLQTELIVLENGSYRLRNPEDRPE